MRRKKKEGRGKEGKERIESLCENIKVSICRIVIEGERKLKKIL